MRVKYCLFVLILLVRGAVCDGQWYEVDPDINGVLRSVRFRNDSVGLIVGHEGIVLLTTDRGLTWDSLPNDLNINFFDFQYINDTLIYAYGSEKVYLSVDSGVNWTVKSTLPGRVDFVYFLDNETGFAGGNINGMYRTSDGGNNWEIVWIYPGENIIYSEQKDIDFLNDSVGFGCGRALKTKDGGYGNIIRTLDRGLSWTVVYESPSQYSWNNPVKIQVINDSSIIAVNVYFQLILSDDMGETWYLREFDAPDPNSWFGMEARSMTAINTDTIIITGEVTVWTLKSGGESKRKILRTVDGGQNWIVQYLDDADRQEIPPLVGDRIFLNDSFGICTGSNLLLRTDNLGGNIHIRDTIQYGGIGDVSGDPTGIRIFPNPTSGLLTLEVLVNHYNFFRVYTLSGRLISELPLDRTMTIDLTEYPPGFYILEFHGQKTYYHRIIKSD